MSKMTEFDLNDQRHFRNNFKDYLTTDSESYVLPNHEIEMNFKVFLIRKIKELLNSLNNQLPKLTSKDVSMYTGLSGIGYFYYKLSKCNDAEFMEMAQQHFNDSLNLTRRSLRHLRERPGSIICDDTGPLTLSVLLNMENQSLEQIVQMSDYIISNNELSDEMLYGRCGYLVALLILHKYQKNISVQLIKQIFKAIIDSGKRLSKMKRKESNNTPPLFYEWHGKSYLGAAHGIAGIMFCLLQTYLDPTLREIKDDLKDDIFDYVGPTIQFLAQLQLPSSNYPSSIGESSKRDVLVQWCHGAPGWTHMFIAAHRVFNDPVYMTSARQICEVIWHRGLLNKGCGICHGTAGNGYSFLALYQYTNEPLYLHRALHFAQWCTDYLNNRTREADRPYSLFEGLAGTLYFLVDCLDPKHAKFPLYEV